jgi:hypothetical protein
VIPGALDSPIVSATQVYVAELPDLVAHDLGGGRVAVRCGEDGAVVYLAGTLPELVRFSHKLHDVIVAEHNARKGTTKGART